MEHKITFAITEQDMKEMELTVDKINAMTANIDTCRVIIQDEGISENGEFKRIN